MYCNIIIEFCQQKRLHGALWVWCERRDFWLSIRSPRVSQQKKAAWSLVGVVLHKSKYLHINSPTPSHQELEYPTCTRQEVMSEVERWQVILSVNYSNYNQGNNAL